MGLLGKLAFWKKKEEPFPAPDLGMPGGLPGEGPDLGLPQPGGPALPGEEQKPGGLGLPELGSDMPGASPSNAFGAPRLEESKPAPMGTPPGAAPMPRSVQPMENKDLEIISLKLDSLKTTLEAINERIARLEKMAEGEKESPRF